jgi:hypothetical protein
MKYKPLTYLATIAMFAAALPAAAQSLSASCAVPAAGIVRTGGLHYSYSIGHTGTSIVKIKSEEASQNKGNAFRSDNIPAKATAYPNPFTEYVSVKIPLSTIDASNIKIQLIDNVGRPTTPQHTEYSTDGIITIHTTGIPQGKYIIKISIGDNTYTINTIKI